MPTTGSQESGLHVCDVDVKYGWNLGQVNVHSFM